MNYSIHIDQINSAAWGLNLTEAGAFAYLYTVPTWADPVTIKGEIFYFVARQKMCQDIPLVVSKEDTAYRILKSLFEKGVIKYVKFGMKDCIQITALGKGWNSEKNPTIATELGKKSESTRKIFRNNSEKNPTYQYTKDQYTKNHIEEPQNENDLLVETHEEFEGMKVTTTEIIPSKPKREPKYIFPPTIEELVPMFYEKLEAKKRDHPQIQTTWNWANMEAEKFFLHWERKGWKIQKLGNAIATWVNGSITYGTVLKPCPVNYKGNPETQLKLTKVRVEEKQVFTQSDIEASEVYSNAANDVFKSLGVRV